MRWFVYNLLFAAGFLLMLPRFAFRMWRRGGYRRNFLDRLGLYGPEVRARLAGRPRIWVHAVSVGEVNVAARFMQAWRERCPAAAFVVTTTTSTGHAVAAGKLTREDVLLYFPVDFPPVCARVLDAVRPPALLLTECELWPNLVRAASARGIPVILINGRVSAASARGYRTLRAFFGPVLRMMSLLLVQGDADRAALAAAGAPRDRLRVMGSAKLAAAPPDRARVEAARALLERLWPGTGRLVLLGGSTWPGEEKALLSAVRALRPDFPGLRLVLVPRHAERRPAVEKAIAESGWKWLRKTALDADGAGAGGDPDVLLVDTTGELGAFYACADVVFVGKSLTARGGQNFVEPAALGKPVIVGPDTGNFPVEARLFEEHAALVRVADERELGRAARLLLADAGRRADLGRRAREVVAAGEGAVGRSVDLILDTLRALKAD
ncbi:MAG: glycosyltransferase [Lentisphaerae bacterium]|nr:glycosyltransferase [Lentisphaerota bacterium]